MVRLRLEFERSEQYEAYEAALRNADSSEPLIRMAELKPHRDENFQSIDLNIPASLLNENNHVLTLNGEAGKGAKSMEAYSFAVTAPVTK